MQITVLYEDEAIIIADKPANLLVHNSYYARNIKEDTLLDLLTSQVGFSLFPVHRLDRKTSGLIILAKRKTEVALFQRMFENHEIQKEYLAIVRGFLEKEVCIDTPVKHPETAVYKDAVSICTPLSTGLIDVPVHPYEQSRYSLVHLMPRTGRIHQLRIHMNKVSHPIIGDAKYGDRFHNRMFQSKFDCHKILLHAYSLTFKHPIKGSMIQVKSTGCPPHWEAIVAVLNWKEKLKTVFKT